MALTDKNLFAYCDNNPVARVDDTGELWEYIAIAGIAATIVGLTIVTAGVAVPLLATTLGATMSITASTFVSTGIVLSEVGIGLTTTAVIGQNITDAIEYSKAYDPDPHARPNQKKQGRELKNKARKSSNWKPKKPPKPPKKHTPGRDHKKY